ncbi:MAG: PhoPQ-activated pathogenicity-like protein PqaA type [Saprospiraceae bacterium]|nr:PhoPQ-activated pathogenicity-like protein PqaA type [Saprospiraceae bacterium]
MKKQLVFVFLLALSYTLFFTACRQTPAISQATEVSLSPLESYIASRDKSVQFEILDTITGKGYQTYILKFVSQEWLTKAEVKDPIWWHWLTVNVPDSLQSHTGMLFIGGGNRDPSQPQQAGESFVEMATTTYSIVAELHNVPNQPLEFVNDDFGPREEDEIISYGWCKFLEGGAKDEDIRWLARLPMTMASVRAMDVLEAFSKVSASKPVDQFVVAGASKRGWATWTTGLADDRVVAIAPIVIDMLNVVPSFEHHWNAYGRWAPAVNDYVREGIMEWQGSKEYARLISLTEPYSFIDRLVLPKCIINATGDQFFLPDSWQFYWNQLVGEKHLRYVPNSEHSMRETDAWSTLLTFYHMIVEETPRPDFDWEVKNGTIHIQTHPNFIPQQMTLWQAHNPEARNFQVDSIGRTYQSTPIEIKASAEYQIKIETPAKGWTAFFVELTFAFKENAPIKWSTGVVVTPDTLPFDDFVSKNPMGTRE